MENNKEKKIYNFIKNTLLFGIATFFPKGILFFMLPLYTAVLSTEEYGEADILFTILSLALPILTLQIQDGVMKYSLQREHQQSEILSVGVKSCLRGTAILCIGVALVQLSGLYVLGLTYYLYLIVNFLFCSLNNVFTYFCKAIDRVNLITVGSILNVAVSVVLNLFFLLYLRMGINGYLIANTLGAVSRVAYIYAMGHFKAYINFHIIEKTFEKEILKFSAPMMFSAIAWWINNASDRFVLSYFRGVSVVGLYAASSKIPAILSSVGEVTSKSFSISAIKEFDKNDSDGFLSDSYSNIGTFLALLCSIVILLNIPISKVLLRGDFYEAWLFCPPLLLSVLFNQMSLSCEKILLAIGKTKIISVTAIASAVVNTCANFILIPMFGAYGAAIATAIGFGVSWMSRYVVMNRNVHMNISSKRIGVTFLLLLIQIVLAYKGNSFIWIQLIIVLILVIANKDLIVFCRVIVTRWRRNNHYGK